MHGSIYQDYEYSSYNPVAYDFANHFCEMAANYHTDTPHILDYNAYPGKQTFIYFLNESIPYFLMNLISFSILRSALNNRSGGAPNVYSPLSNFSRLVSFASFCFISYVCYKRKVSWKTTKKKRKFKEIIV